MALGQQAIAIKQIFSRWTGIAAAAVLLVATVSVAHAQQVASLSPDLLSGHVVSKATARLQHDVTFQPEKWLEPSAPTVDSDMLSAYVATKFVPTVKRVELAENERLCLAQAIYHEARGETEAGQWAVANVILNRVLSKRYPSTICGVVFQNAGGAKYRCQFTFACDGRSDMGGNGNRIVRESWVRANLIAFAAYRLHQNGEQLDALPPSVLYYHTKNVSPRWASVYRAVAEIGSHIFYAPS